MKTLLTCFLFLSLHSANADISDLSQKLDEIDQENSTQVQQINVEAEILTEEKIEIETQLSDISGQIEDLEKEKTEIMKPLEIALTYEKLDELLSNYKKIGACELKPGLTPGEYHISDGKKIIRTFFAPLESEFKPIVKMVKKDEAKYFELIQPQFTPDKIEPKSKMESLLRFDEINHIVIHATFRGQLLQDEWFGYGSSYKAHQLTCLLNPEN